MKIPMMMAAVGLVAALTAQGADYNYRLGGLKGLDPFEESPPYEIGLALSGGGARGLSAIGLLKAFEDRRIKVVALAGTSIGGVIGGLYACGYAPDELQEIVRDLDIAALIATRPPRSTMFLTRRQERERYLLSVRFDGLRPQIPNAFTGAQEITSRLARLTTRANYLAGGDFTRLPIPFKTTATDVVSGEAVILSSGSLTDALRATIAFPLAFTGIEQGDRLLMDGGMLLPVPTEVVRQMVPPTVPVIAVNTASFLLASDELRSAVDIANQVTTVMTAAKLKRQLALADLVVEPLSGEFSSTDFDLSDSLVGIGYEAGLHVAQRVAQLVQDRQGAAVFRPSRFEIISSDQALAETVRRAGLERPFRLNQMLVDLKTLMRTEPIYEIELSLDVLGPDSALGADSLAAVRIVVVPRPVTSELAVIFQGHTVFDDATLMALVDFPEPTVSPGDLNRLAEEVAALYAEHGYDLAHLRTLDLDVENSRLVLVVDEAIIGRIDVKHNERCRDWLIRSYFPMSRGEPFSTGRASDGLADLYGTELFDRVMLDLEPGEAGALMTIGVREKKYAQARLGWHWHDEFRSEQFVELLDDNVNGIGLEYLLHAQYGEDRQAYYTGFRIDRIFFSYLTARLRFAYNLLDRTLFDVDGEVVGLRDENRWGVSFDIGQQIARLGRVTAGLRLEEIRLTDRLRQTTESFGLRTLQFESVVESFDRYPFPTTGSKMVMDLRLAGKFIGGEIEYTRFFSSFEAYHSLGSRLTLHPTVSLGLSRTGLPASEKFYAGGLYSFSGYRGNELSGDKIFIFNYEARLNLPYRFYLSGRYDVGDVYASSEEIKLKKLRQGLGASLAYDSPLGPLIVGYGGGDSPKDRVYVFAGFRF